MFTEKDIRQMSAKGINEAQVRQQLQQFETGFPYLKIASAASVGNGIMRLSDDDVEKYIDVWNKYLDKDNDIVKFVPASGAASRMFKELFAFIDAEYDTPQTDFEKTFFGNIRRFAFYDELNKVCLSNCDQDIDGLMGCNRHKDIARNLLGADGLNYGKLPKGLLSFHKYSDDIRTPLEEHLVEGALYANTKGQAKIHFTVSNEHNGLFAEKVKEKQSVVADRYGVAFDISFSEQKPSTDTIAVDTDNKPFRNADGSLLFRPGGHGALIENLNDIDADIVFVKNIDNIVPDRLKDETVKYKKVIAGLLVSIQEKVFRHIKQLNSENISRSQLLGIASDMQDCLMMKLPVLDAWDDSKIKDFLKDKLNRPMRVCGVVKNVGEPGGGPFVIEEKDNTTSLQILESSQIDKSNERYVRMFNEGTHFNPVDLVCALKDVEGKHFNLLDYVDPTTGFISVKSKDGKELKALELPGLWNGAMSKWITLFVEVPLITFNPVKTVNDLLRNEHQA